MRSRRSQDLAVILRMECGSHCAGEESSAFPQWTSVMDQMLKGQYRETGWFRWDCLHICLALALYLYHRGVSEIQRVTQMEILVLMYTRPEQLQTPTPWDDPYFHIYHCTSVYVEMRGNGSLKVKGKKREGIRNHALLPLFFSPRTSHYICLSTVLFFILYMIPTFSSRDLDFHPIVMLFPLTVSSLLCLSLS